MSVQIYEKVHPLWVTCYKRVTGQVVLYVFTGPDRWVLPLRT